MRFRVVALVWQSFSAYRVYLLSKSPFIPVFIIAVGNYTYLFLDTPDIISRSPFLPPSAHFLLVLIASKVSPKLFM
jgi:hypothetical protein